jgi:hypothetical protein
MNKIDRLVECRGVDVENRTAQFVISTESVDRHGTVFKLAGWELDSYNRNPIVGYNHVVSGDNPDTIIGTSRVFQDGDALIGEVTFEREGNNPLADKVFNKMNDGILKMASVGAIPHEYRYGDSNEGEDRDTVYFTRQELIEWSVVSAGSNRDAFKRSADQVDEIKKSLEEIVEEVPVTMGLATKANLRNFGKVKILTKYL